MAGPGAAADYYQNDGMGMPADNRGYGYNGNAQYGMQNGQPEYKPPQDGPPPPQYGGNYNQNYAQTGAGQMPYSEKPTFDQAFKLDRPRWNDLWAGILVCEQLNYFTACY